MSPVAPCDATAIVKPDFSFGQEIQRQLGLR